MNQMPHIMLIAAEASGDALGADLIQQYHKRAPQTVFSAMGGPQIAATGADMIVDASQLAIVGVWEAIQHIRPLWLAMRRIKQHLKTLSPTLLILIDYPGFNLRVARCAKELNIPVLYYVSPQIWAWRPSRIEVIRECVSHMAVLFPFEAKIYQKASVPVSVVGHPLVTQAKPLTDRAQAYADIGLSAHRPVLAILPGSRTQELERHHRLLQTTLHQLQQKQPDLQFVVIKTPHLKDELYQSFHELDGVIVSDKLSSALTVADAAICASGTATLEVALYQVPLLIFYRVTPLTYWLGRRLVNIPYIGLCNIVAEQCIAKEFIQQEASVKNLVAESEKLLNDEHYRLEKIKELKKLKDTLKQIDDNKNIADVIQDVLAHCPPSSSTDGLSQT